MCYMVLMKGLRLPDIDVIYYDPTNIEESGRKESRGSIE